MSIFGDDAAEHVRKLDPNASAYVAAEINVDGLRIVAWLAQYLDEGEDPLRLVVNAMIECGLDVNPEDCEWALEEETVITPPLPPASRAVRPPPCSSPADSGV